MVTLTFYLAPSSGQNLNVVYDQISSKLHSHQPQLNSVFSANYQTLAEKAERDVFLLKLDDVIGLIKAKCQNVVVI